VVEFTCTKLEYVRNMSPGGGVAIRASGQASCAFSEQGRADGQLRRSAFPKIVVLARLGDGTASHGEAGTEAHPTGHIRLHCRRELADHGVMAMVSFIAHQDSVVWSGNFNLEQSIFADASGAY
jgi:hypothetical protein